MQQRVADMQAELEQRDVEVDEETEPAVGETEVGEELSLMDRLEVLYRFEFDDEEDDFADDSDEAFDDDEDELEDDDESSFDEE